MHKHPSYTIPAAGEKFPGIEQNPHENPGPMGGMTKLTQWEQGQAQVSAFRKNEVLAAEWLNIDFGNWLISYQAGRIRGPKGMGDPDATPPSPPPAFYAVAQTNEGGGIVFSVEQVPLDETGTPVCDPPEYEKIPAPQHYKG